jgi:glycosyltransferase involved in cell wall biosynthesis
MKNTIKFAIKNIFLRKSNSNKNRNSSSLQELRDLVEKCTIDIRSDELRSEPLVSICTISYNHSLFIKDALDSFIAQTTTFPIEIVIGDDGSTDGTTEILLDYQQRYPTLIRVLVSKDNLSQFNSNKSAPFVPNFVRTLDSCRGKYIALCEGDDYWIDPLKLQKQVDFLEANPDFSICFHKVKILEGGELTDDTLTNNCAEVSSIVDLAKGNYIQTPSCMYRNRGSDILGSNFQNSPAGDYYLHMMNAQYGKIYYIDEVMAVYRIHPNSIWSSQYKSVRFQKFQESRKAIMQDLLDKSSKASRVLLIMFIASTINYYCPSVLKSVVIFFRKSFVPIRGLK